jgi:hypothetical protein
MAAAFNDSHSTSTLVAFGAFSRNVTRPSVWTSGDASDCEKTGVARDKAISAQNDFMAAQYRGTPFILNAKDFRG